MRELNNITERGYRDDRTNFFEENPNVFKNIDDISDTNIKNISNGEPIIDTINNRILIKKDGVFNKLIIDGTDIILEEV